MYSRFNRPDLPSTAATSISITPIGPIAPFASTACYPTHFRRNTVKCTDVRAPGPDPEHTSLRNPVTTAACYSTHSLHWFGGGR